MKEVEEVLGMGAEGKVDVGKEGEGWDWEEGVGLQDTTIEVHTFAACGM